MLPTSSIGVKKMGEAAWHQRNVQKWGFARMNASSRLRIVLPLVSLAFAFSAQAQELNHPGQNHAPAQRGGQLPPRPGLQAPAAGAGAVHAQGLVHPQGIHPQGIHPQGGMPGGRGPDARFARGAITAHNYGGHPYRGRLGWEGGRWRHEVHNGRDGWWWDVGGVWYYYPERLDGPPAYISEDFADDVVYADAPVAAAAYPPPPGAPPPPPDPGASAVGGAIVGGVLGGLLTGRASGAAAGAVIGGATGAIAGATAAARPGYYLAEGNCYYRYPSGNYVQADPRWCY
jgi:hypothetical protein